MQDCKPIPTYISFNSKISLSMSPSNETMMMKISWLSYALAVESLMYAMTTCIRPDIAKVIRVVSRWSVIETILKHIKGTSCVALCFRGSKLVFKDHVDSDFAGDLDKRRSSTNYVFTVAGGTISCLSKL